MKLNWLKRLFSGSAPVAEPKSFGPWTCIPKDYSIMHVQAVRYHSELFVPMFRGNYIKEMFRISAQDTTDSLAHGAHFHTVDGAINYIKAHMEWRHPKILPRDKWPVVFLTLLLLCGCNQSASTVREEKHFNGADGYETWVYTIDIDGHRFAVASGGRGISICEVTDRSLVPTPTQADPMSDPSDPIRNSWNGWGIIQVTPGFMAEDWLSNSNRWVRLGIESRIVQVATNGLTVIAYRRTNALVPMGRNYTNHF